MYVLSFLFVCSEINLLEKNSIKANDINIVFFIENFFLFQVPMLKLL